MVGFPVIVCAPALPFTAKTFIADLIPYRIVVHGGYGRLILPTMDAITAALHYFAIIAGAQGDILVTAGFCHDGIQKRASTPNTQAHANIL